MPTYETISDLNNDLVRKALKGSLFVAPESAAAITAATLFSTGGELQTLPTGYEDGGLTTDEGLRFSRSTETSTVTSWQRTTPTRSDKTSDVETLQVDFQELKKTTLGLYTGADLSAVTLAASGALSIQKPAIPEDAYFRLLALAVDMVDGEELVVARFYPRAKVDSFADQAWSKGDSALNWGMTFTTYVDEDLGYSKDDIFGGAGWSALLADMGFTAPTATVPDIDSASPVTGPAAGGTLVEITGSGFAGVTGATGVKFVATNAASYVVVDDNTIVAVTPAHSAAAGPIVVTNPTGPSTNGPDFTYT